MGRAERISDQYWYTYETHVCTYFVALKVYKKLERLLELSHINMSMDKVRALLLGRQTA